MGMRAVIIISFEKKIAFANSPPVLFINPNFDNKLNFGIPTCFALWSRATNNPSTITTAPSIIIPKSIAPIEIKLADMPLIFMQINAKSNDNGMIIETIIVALKSAIKRNTINVTRIIPSVRFPSTVFVQKLIRLSLS